MDGSPEPSAAATHVLEGLQKGMEKVLSTLGIHELRGYGRLVSAIGVSPEVLDILAIPGFCASDGRGLGLDGLDALAEQGRQIRAGEESPSKVKLPRMYPKVWKALARVATSERGYEEYAETLDKLEDRAARGPAPRGAAAAGRARGPHPGRPRSASKVGEHDAAVPDQLDELRQPGRGRLPRRTPRRPTQADMLCMNGEGGEIPDMYGTLPQAPRPADRQRPLRRLVAADQLVGVGRDQDRPGRQARRGRPPAGLEGDPGDRPGPQRAGRQRPDQPVEQPRPLLDRGPGPAHRRAEDLQPARQGHRQGARRAGHRDDRDRHRQGGRRRHHDVGLRRRHRRGAPARPAPRRPALRDRHGPRPPRPHRGGHPRPGRDLGRRRPAQRRGLHQADLHGRQPAGLRHGRDGRHRLHDLPRLPARHLPRRHRHAARRGGGARARPQALRAARLRPLGRHPGAVLHRDGRRPAGARRSDGRLRRAGAGRPGRPPRAGVAPRPARPDEPAHPGPASRSSPRRPGRPASSGPSTRRRRTGRRRWRPSGSPPAPRWPSRRRPRRRPTATSAPTSPG